MIPVRPLMRLFATAFRFLPWPTRPGLRAIGEPGPDSPVLLTGNFVLTVDCVKQALGELDAWLLVANSHGINVWCAAAGGHLSTHDVISALKTTSVAQRVDHRQVVLPQLAATGVETDLVWERTGWKAVWGPVYAEDLPGFVQGEETLKMRKVHFELRQRLDMAVMWAAPVSLLAVGSLLFWPGGFLWLLALTWGLTLSVYVAFPLYEGLVRRGNLVEFWALFGSVTAAGVTLVGALIGRLSPSFLLRWIGLGLALVVLLGFDLAGSTPLFKSWSHEERGYRVELNGEQCVVCGRCAQVCPRGVFVVDDTASMPHAERCEKCGTCIVQCPVDALAFITPDGGRVPPEDIRRYKLNLMGKRRSVSESA